jgi:hypothetical protein
VAFSPTEVLPTGDPQLGGYIALMFLGFVVGVAGHVVHSKAMIATGIGMIFLAVFLLPLVVQGGS